MKLPVSMMHLKLRFSPHNLHILRFAKHIMINQFIMLGLFYKEGCHKIVTFTVQKQSFPLRITSVSVTKFAVSCGRTKLKYIVKKLKYCNMVTKVMTLANPAV